MLDDWLPLQRKSARTIKGEMANLDAGGTSTIASETGINGDNEEKAVDEAAEDALTTSAEKFLHIELMLHLRAEIKYVST